MSELRDRAIDIVKKMEEQEEPLKDMVKKLESLNGYNLAASRMGEISRMIKLTIPYVEPSMKSLASFINTASCDDEAVIEDDINKLKYFVKLIDKAIDITEDMHALYSDIDAIEKIADTLITGGY